MLTIFNVLDLFSAKDDFLEMKTCLLFVLMIDIATTVICWTDSGNIRYANDCVFHGNNLRSVKMPHEQCGPKCDSIGYFFMI